jgi:glutaredoxin
MTPLLAARSFAAVAALACLASGAAVAQYKVIGPDGRVTYTDREPSSSEGGRVVPLGARSATAAPEPELPFELRQVVARFPVTLYTISNACDPCSSARTMLRQRGIPFNERQVLSNEDSEALEKLSGGRDAPTLTIGAQTLRGYSSEVWSSYLDAAGYPRESKLPPTYAYRPATPIVERPPAQPRAAVAPAAATPAAPNAPPPGTAGIRF